MPHHCFFLKCLSAIHQCYFETREREERFIRQIISEVEKALDKVLPVYLTGFMSGVAGTAKNDDM